jgi:hypothetical protein
MPVSQRRLLKKSKAFTYWCALVACQTWFHPGGANLVTLERTQRIYPVLGISNETRPYMTNS